MREFAEKAQDLSPENNEYKMFYFGKISENTAHRIKNDLGKNHDFSNHNLSISNYEIKKIYKDHSKSKEVERGQKIIEPKDFIKIPEVVSQYTSVVESGDYNGNPTFIFSKEYENGEKFNVVAYESKGRHLIIIQTMYINKKMSLADPTTEQATVNTPEASIGTASFSNKSIAQESEKDNENKEKDRVNLGWEIGTDLFDHRFRNPLIIFRLSPTCPLLMIGMLCWSSAPAANFLF